MLTYFNESNVKVFLYIIITIFALLFALIPIIVIILGKKAELNIDKKTKELEENWKKKDTFISYEKIQKMLIRNGAEVNFKQISEPIGFIEVSLLCGFLFALVISFWTMYFIILAYILGVFFPYILIKQKNATDNKDMLFDISLIYNALYTQIEAGVYPDDAIRECYSVVTNNRLRKAMFTLTGNMERRDLSFVNSLEIFRDCFNNPQIESLKIILEQAKTSGKAAEALKDVLEQIKEIEESVLFLKKEKIGTRSQMYEIAFFTGIVVVIITYSMKFITATITSF